jgi:hypothetical protein
LQPRGSARGPRWGRARADPRPLSGPSGRFFHPRGERLIQGIQHPLRAWHTVYEGLSEEDIAEVEAMALDPMGPEDR